MFFGREQVVILQLVVGHAEGFEHLPQRTLVALGHHTLSAQQSEPLRGLLVHLSHGSPFRCPPLLYLVQIDGHGYSFFINCR